MLSILVSCVNIVSHFTSKVIPENVHRLLYFTSKWNEKIFRYQYPGCNYSQLLMLYVTWVIHYVPRSSWHITHTSYHFTKECCHPCHTAYQCHVASVKDERGATLLSVRATSPTLHSDTDTENSQLSASQAFHRWDPDSLAHISS